MIVTASQDSSLGPTVGFAHPVKEQCQPERIAAAIFVFFEKSSRFLVRFSAGLMFVPVRVNRFWRIARQTGRAVAPERL